MTQGDNLKRKTKTLLCTNFVKQNLERTKIGILELSFKVKFVHKFKFCVFSIKAEVKLALRKEFSRICEMNLRFKPLIAKSSWKLLVSTKFEANVRQLVIARRWSQIYHLFAKIRAKIPNQNRRQPISFPEGCRLRCFWTDC